MEHNSFSSETFSKLERGKKIGWMQQESDGSTQLKQIHLAKAGQHILTVRREQERHFSKTFITVINPEASFRAGGLCKSKGGSAMDERKWVWEGTSFPFSHKDMNSPNYSSEKVTFC